MKSSSSGGAAGNIKMRGKKTRMYSCGCCDAVNFKWDYRKKMDNKEIREAKINAPVAEW